MEIKCTRHYEVRVRVTGDTPGKTIGIHDPVTFRDTFNSYDEADKFAREWVANLKKSPRNWFGYKGVDGYEIREITILKTITKFDEVRPEGEEREYQL